MANFEEKHHIQVSRSPSPTLIYPVKLTKLGDAEEVPVLADHPEKEEKSQTPEESHCTSNEKQCRLSQSPEGRAVWPRRRRSSRDTSHLSLAPVSSPGRTTMVTDIDQAMAHIDEVKLKALFGDTLTSLGTDASPNVTHSSFHSGDETEETNIDDEPVNAKMVASMRQKSLESELIQAAAASTPKDSSNHKRQGRAANRQGPTFTFSEVIKWPAGLPKALDVKEFQDFEGETLMNWLCSQFDESHYLHHILTRHDFHIIIGQFCTHLLSAGVLQEMDTKQKGSAFKTQNQYKWGAQDAGQERGLSTEASAGTPLAWPSSHGNIQEGCSDGEIRLTLTHTETDKQENIAQARSEFIAYEERLKRDHEEEILHIRESFSAQIERLGQEVLALQEELRKCKTIAGIDALTQEALNAAEAARQEAGLTGGDTSHHAQGRLLTVTGTLTNDHLAPQAACSTVHWERDFHPPSEGSVVSPPLPPPPPPPPLPPPPLPEGCQITEQQTSNNFAPPDPPPASPPLLGCPPPPPPPPSLGGPPPPPPPPGSQETAQRKEPTKPIINPKSPMKPLFWKRLQVQALKSSKESNHGSLFWEDVLEEPINFDHLEELFAKVSMEPKKKATTSKAKPRTVQHAKVIPPKRSQAVGILLSSLRLEFSDIEEAILNLNTSVLDVEKFKAIYDNRPVDEELTLIKSHLQKHPEIPLDKPEQFLHDLEQIPYFADRIFCFIFQSSFQENITMIDRKLNNLKMTCEFLTSYEGVRRIFGLILTCGNYMNGGSRTRGQADGFDLEILQKLKDVKGKDNRTSLLQFVVSGYVCQFDKDIMGTDRAKLPLPDPSDIQQAALVNFEDVQKELRKIRKDFESAESKANTIIRCSHSESLEPFRTIMLAFFDKGKQDLQEEEETLTDCSKLFDCTCRFFCIKPKNNDKAVIPEHFFSLWLSFCSDFKDIWKKEQQRLIKLRLKEAEEKVKAIKESKIVLPATRAKKVGGLKDKLSRQGKI